jgi:LmbE family N-acetylglucosaminyl deacetylase
MDWRLTPSTPVNALLLHAHPDDETIFAGGLLLNYPDWVWTLVCMTMQSRARLREYEAAVTRFVSAGVNLGRSVTLQQKDVGQRLGTADMRRWKHALEALELTPSIVFTHNSRGEYGHGHHIALSDMSHQVYDNVWEFYYPNGEVPQRRGARLNKVRLDNPRIWLKREIFESCYRSQSPGLWRDLGALMAYQFTSGCELFTSGSELASDGRSACPS